MRVIKRDVTTGSGGKRYDRTEENCANDDVWATVQIPQSEDET